MSTDANVVVIGAGIIGSSVAYHLAELGVDDIMVVDKGDLDHNDGSTSHAPGGLRTLTGSHFFTTLGRAGRDVYDQLPLAVPGQEQFYRVGTIAIANTPERLDAHRRLCDVGLSEGLEATMLSPSEIADRLPMVDPSTIEGGLTIPSSGVVETSLIATSMRQVAEATGRARFVGHSEVTDIEVTGGRIVSVTTDGDAGTIRCQQAIVCTNIWAPLLAERTGTAMPLVPGEHQYIFTTPVPAVSDIADQHVALPVTGVVRPERAVGGDVDQIGAPEHCDGLIARGAIAYGRPQMSAIMSNSPVSTGPGPLRNATRLIRNRSTSDIQAPSVGARVNGGSCSDGRRAPCDVAQRRRDRQDDPIDSAQAERFDQPRIEFCRGVAQTFQFDDRLPSARRRDVEVLIAEFGSPQRSPERHRVRPAGFDLGRAPPR